MKDKYANWMFQSLISRCTPIERQLILKRIKDDFFEIANDKKGTHSLQSLVSYCNYKILFCDHHHPLFNSGNQQEEEIIIIESIKA
jgi:hypothetical protein